MARHSHHGSCVVGLDQAAGGEEGGGASQGNAAERAIDEVIYMHTCYGQTKYINHMYSNS